jgi:hypothetical protein
LRRSNSSSSLFSSSSSSIINNNNINNNNKNDNSGRRPEPSQQEKEKLRQVQLMEAEKKRKEDEKLIELLINDKKKFVSKQKRGGTKTKGKTKEKIISARKIYDRLIELGYRSSWYSPFFRNGNIFVIEGDATIIEESRDDMTNLALLLLEPFGMYSQFYTVKSNMSETEYDQYLEAINNLISEEVDLRDKPKLTSAIVDRSYTAMKVTVRNLFPNDKKGILVSSLLSTLMFLRVSNKLDNPESDVFKILTAEIFTEYMIDDSCQYLIGSINGYINILNKSFSQQILSLKIYIVNIIVNWRYLSRLFLLEYLSHPQFRNLVKHRLVRNPTLGIGPKIDLSCLKHFVPVIPKESARIIAL